MFVLFGATGDLAKRMVLPAFYNLMTEGLLPHDWLLIGNGRGDVSHLDFRAHVHEVLNEFGPRPSAAQWKQFSERLLFAGGGFDSSSPGSLLDVVAGQPHGDFTIACPAFPENQRTIFNGHLFRRPCALASTPSIPRCPPAGGSTSSGSASASRTSGDPLFRMSS